MRLIGNSKLAGIIILFMCYTLQVYAADYSLSNKSGTTTTIRNTTTKTNTKTIKTIIKLNPMISGYSYPGTCVKKGASVTIKGTNFGTKKGRVALGSGNGAHVLDLPVSSWSTGQIVATVPKNKTIKSGPGYFIALENTSHGWRSNINKTFSICYLLKSVIIKQTNKATLSTDLEAAAETAPAKQLSAFGSLLGGELPPPPQDLPRIKKSRKRGIEPREIVVISANMNQARALANLASSLGIGIKRRHNLSSLGLVMTVLRAPKGVPIDRALTSLRQTDRKAWADTNNLFQLHGNDARRYGAKLIGWNPARADSCGKGVRIGLIDTGIDKTHPSLKGRTIVTRSFVTTGMPRADTAHGTATASLLVGNNEFEDIAGLLPGAKLYVASIFRKQGKKRVNTTAEWIVLALDWLASQRTQVINLSLGGSRNILVEAAISRLLERDFVIVASAGNNGTKAAPVYPAAQEGVIAVTAIDAKLKPYRRANRGDYISFAAPGVDVWLAKPGRKGAYLSGTSYAAPYVTASIAGARMKKKKLAWVKLKQQLAKNARDLGIPGKDPVYGWGLVQPGNVCN